MFKTRVVKEIFTLTNLRLLKISLMRKLLVVQLKGIKRVSEWYTQTCLCLISDIKILSRF